MLFDQTWSAVSGFWRSLGQGLPMQAEVLFVRVSWYSSCTCISNIWTFICTNSVLSLSVFFKMFLWNTCFFRHGNPHFKRKPRRRWHGKQIKTPFFVDECYTNLCFHYTSRVHMILGKTNWCTYDCGELFVWLSTFPLWMW